MTQTTLDSPVKVPTFHAISFSRKLKNKVATTLFTASFLIALIPLVWLLYTVIARGFTAITSSSWWTRSLAGVLPEQVAGGVYHAIYGTIVQALIAAVLSVPLGVMAAVYLVEYGKGRLAKVTTFMVDILAGVPSIVAALFIFALWVTTLGFPQSAFAVSLALVLLMLPVVVRNTEEMLKLVPDELREASYALGVPKWKTILRIVIPTALPGHHQRHLACAGPSHGRDRSGARAGRLQQVDQLRRARRQHGIAAAVDLHRTDQPRGRWSTASVGRRADPHPADCALVPRWPRSPTGS